LLRLKIPGAWIAAMLFALHPMNVASVTWVAERKNTLSLVFALASVLAYLRVDEKRWLWFPLSLVFAAAALLSKGATVVLAPALLLIVWWKKGRLEKRDFLELAPFFAMALLGALCTVHFQRQMFVGQPLPQGGAPLFKIVRATWALGFYLAKTVLPLRLAPIYPQWDIHVSSMLAYLPACGLVALIILLFWLRQRDILFVLAVFAICILPVVGLVDAAYFEQAPAADWWNYMAMLPICALAGAGLAWLDAGNRPLGGFFATAILFCFAILTWLQEPAYSDPETHSRIALAMNPIAYMARNNLGLVLADRGDLDGALEQYEKALAQNPRCLQAHTNIATVLADKGRYADAESHLRKVLDIVPHDPKTRNNLGGVLFREGKVKEAIQECTASLDQFPYNAEAHNNLGLALAASGDLPSAIAQYREALEINRNDPGAWFNAGAAFSQQGRHDLAVNAFGHAIECSPGMASAYNRLAQEFVALKQPAKAVGLLQKLFEISPKRGSDPVLLETLALAQEAAGENGMAAETLRSAIQNAEKRNNRELLDRLNTHLLQIQQIAPKQE
jgi:tetratricopeptide (TPR) repeat protein